MVSISYVAAGALNGLPLVNSKTGLIIGAVVYISLLTVMSTIAKKHR